MLRNKRTSLLSIWMILTFVDMRILKHLPRQTSQLCNSFVIHGVMGFTRYGNYHFSTLPLRQTQIKQSKLFSSKNYSKIPPSKLTNLKTKLPILDFIQSNYNLPKFTRTSNQGKACCPFHQEKTPSFFINSEKQIFKCFGCGVGGDIFQFVRLMEDLNGNQMGYYDAVEHVARTYLSQEVKLNKPLSPEEKLKERLKDINRAASHYYIQQLHSPKGGKARMYLYQRGITPQTCSKFSLGYAPPSYNNLVLYLQGLNYTSDDIVASGLAKRRYDDMCDRFENRLMIPILEYGHVIAFGARTFTNAAKYINSPETPIFSKKHTVFNHHATTKEVIVVEGYFDVLALDSIGYDSVSCMGTALSIEQITKLKSKKIIVCLDNDEAGKNATVRFCNLLASTNENIQNFLDSIYVATIPNKAKDPCDYIYNKRSFHEILDKTQSWKDWYIHYLFERYDLKEVVDKITDFLSCKVFCNEVDRTTYITTIIPKLITEENEVNEHLKNQLQIDLLQMTNRKMNQRNILEKRIETQQLKEVVRTPEQIRKSMYRGNEVTDVDIISSSKQPKKQEPKEDVNFSGFYFPSEDYTWLASEEKILPSYKQQQKNNFLTYGRKEKDIDLYEYYQSKNVYFNPNGLTISQDNVIQEQSYKALIKAEDKVLKILLLYPKTRSSFKAMSDMQSSILNDHLLLQWTHMNKEWLFTCILSNDDELDRIGMVMEQYTVDQSFGIMKLRDYFANREDVPPGAFYSHEETKRMKEQAILDEFFIALLEQEEEMHGAEMAQLILQESFYTMQKCLATRYVSTLKREWRVCNELLYPKLIANELIQDEEFNCQAEYYNLLTNTQKQNYSNMTLSNLKKWSDYLATKLTSTQQKLQSLQNTIRTISSNIINHRYTTSSKVSKSKLQKLVDEIDEFVDSLPDDEHDSPGDDGVYLFGDDSYEKVDVFGGRNDESKEENAYDTQENTYDVHNYWDVDRDDYDTLPKDKGTKSYDYERYSEKLNKENDEELVVINKEEEMELDDILTDFEEEEQSNDTSSVLKRNGYQVNDTTNDIVKIEQQSESYLDDERLQQQNSSTTTFKTPIVNGKTNNGKERYPRTQEQYTSQSTDNMSFTFGENEVINSPNLDHVEESFNDLMDDIEQQEFSYIDNNFTLSIM